VPAAEQPEELAFAWQDAHYRWVIRASKISLWLSDPSRSAGLGQQSLQMQEGLKANLIWNCQGKNAHGGSCKTYSQSGAAFEHQLVSSEVAFIPCNGFSNLWFTSNLSEARSVLSVSYCAL